MGLPSSWGMSGPAAPSASPPGEPPFLVTCNPTLRSDHYGPELAHSHAYDAAEFISGALHTRRRHRWTIGPHGRRAGRETISNFGRHPLQRELTPPWVPRPACATALQRSTRTEHPTSMRVNPEDAAEFGVRLETTHAFAACVLASRPSAKTHRRSPSPSSARPHSSLFNFWSRSVKHSRSSTPRRFSIR